MLIQRSASTKNRRLTIKDIKNPSPSVWGGILCRVSPYGSLIFQHLFAVDDDNALVGVVDGYAIDIVDDRGGIDVAVVYLHDARWRGACEYELVDIAIRAVDGDAIGCCL